MVSPLNEHAYADEGGLSDAPTVCMGFVRKLATKWMFTMCLPKLVLLLKVVLQFYSNTQTFLSS
jgi:hypothetical protein